MNNLECAVYVTAGNKAYNPNCEWGGCHITLSGFSTKNGDNTKLIAAAQIAEKTLNVKNTAPWKPDDWTVKNWKQVWTIVIKSGTLNKVADMLNKEGFERIKGPKHTPNKTAFHISVPHAKSKEEAEEYARSLSDNNWFITIAQKKSPKDFDWIQYSQLNKF